MGLGLSWQPFQKGKDRTAADLGWASVTEPAGGALESDPGTLGPFWWALRGHMPRGGEIGATGLGPHPAPSSQRPDPSSS